MRSESVFYIIHEKAAVVVYSPPESIEQFYLLKVKEFGTATAKKEDYNHCIKKGERFIKRQCLEKTLEKKGFVHYNKFVKDEVYVLLTQIMYPLVTIKDDLTVPIGEYLWLPGCIGISNH